jgi:hypothetical protein
MFLTSRIHRRAAPVIAAAVAAVALTAADVAGPAPVAAAHESSPSTPPRPPSEPLDTDASRQPPDAADSAGAFVYRNTRFRPLAGIDGAAASAHVNINNRGQVVGVYFDAHGTIGSFVKDRHGQVTTFAVPAPRQPLPQASTTAARSPAPTTTPGSRWEKVRRRRARCTDSSASPPARSLGSTCRRPSTALASPTSTIAASSSARPLTPKDGVWASCGTLTAQSRSSM